MTVVGQAIVAVRPNMAPFKADAAKGISAFKAKPVKIRADVPGFKKSLGGITKAIGLIGAGVGLAKVGGFLKDSVSAASDLSESLSKTRVVFGSASKGVESFAKTAATSLGLSRQAALEATSTFGNLLTSLGLAKQPAADMSKAVVTLAGDLASFNNVKPEEALLALRAGLTGEAEPLKRFGVNLNEATIKAKALAMGIGDGKAPLDAASKAQAAYALIMDQTKNAQGDFTRTSAGLANQQRILAANVEDLKAKIGGALLPIVNSAVAKFNKWLPVIQKVSGEIIHFVDTLSNAKDWKARVSIIWDKLGDAKDALMKALFGSSTGSGDKFVHVDGIVDNIRQAFQSVDWSGVRTTIMSGLFGTNLGQGDKAVHIDGIVDNIRQAFLAVDWSGVGANIASAIGGAIDAAKPIAEDIGSKIDGAVEAIRARMPEFANLGAELIASIFVTLTDPAFWLAHWQLAIGVAIAVIPLGKFIGAGGKIILFLLKPLTKLGGRLSESFVKAVVELVGHAPEWGSKIGSALWTAIKAAARLADRAAGQLVDLVAGVIRAGWAKLPGIVRAAMQLLVKLGIVQTAIDAYNKAKEFGTKVYNGIVDKVKTIAAKVVQFVGQIPTVIGSWISAAAGKARDIGVGIINGIVEGIKSSPGAVKNALGGIVDGAISSIKHKLGINSPSKLTRDLIGKGLVEGIIDGIFALGPRLKNAMSQAVSDAVVAAKQNLSSLAGTLSSSVNQLLDKKLSNSPAAKALQEAQAKQAGLELTSQIEGLKATIADVETSAADKAKAEADLAVLLAQQVYDAEAAKVEAAQSANEQILADLAQALNRGLITQADYQKKVTELLASQGVDYKTAGDNLGLAFADGFLAQLNDMLDQARLVVQGGLPDVNALSTALVNPIATLNTELDDAKKRVTDLTKDAKSKDGPGGKKITKAEQRQIDLARDQVKLLSDLKAAMEAIPQTNINIGGGTITALDLVDAINRLVAAAIR